MRGGHFLMQDFFERNIWKLITSLCIVLLVVFVIGVFSSAVLRYVLNFGLVKIEDFVGYSFGALVILSLLVAFYKNVHVRVNMMPSLQQVFEKRLLLILSALPFVIVAFLSVPAVYFSWSVFEGSREVDGLGGLFLVKALLPVSCLLIVIFLCVGRKDTKQ